MGARTAATAAFAAHNHALPRHGRWGRLTATIVVAVHVVDPGVVGVAARNRGGLASAAATAAAPAAFATAVTARALVSGSSHRARVGKSQTVRAAVRRIGAPGRDTELALAGRRLRCRARARSGSGAHLAAVVGRIPPRRRLCADLPAAAASWEAGRARVSCAATRKAAAGPGRHAPLFAGRWFAFRSAMMSPSDLSMPGARWRVVGENDLTLSRIRSRAHSLQTNT